MFKMSLALLSIAISVGSIVLPSSLPREVRLAVGVSGLLGLLVSAPVLMDGVLETFRMIDAYQAGSQDIGVQNGKALGKIALGVIYVGILVAIVAGIFRRD
jgi:hypothetical protein